MIWEEILEHVVAATNHERYRQLAAEGAPAWRAWRGLVTDRYYRLTADPPLEDKNASTPAEWVHGAAEAIAAPCGCYGGVPSAD